jgi:hypothetical protein
MSNPLESWTEEQRSALLYRACADAEKDDARAELFRRLAGEAEAQAAIWRAQLTARGHPAPVPYVPDARTRLIMKLVGKLGPRRMRTMLAAMKVRGMGIYDLTLPGEAGHGVPRPGSGAEHRHRGLHGGGNLRAAVFGINDGLVSNASLILGVAGASPDVRVVLLTGIAGMCAGAFAMATGEYVSVRSQRELFEYQIGLERDELAQYPEAEAQELALIYAAKGLRADEASKLASRIVADPEHALDTLAREELGLNPDELGSPWGAAVASFLSFRSRRPASARALRDDVRAEHAAGGDRGDRAGALRRRRAALVVHGTRGPALRLADALARRTCRRRNVCGGPPRRCRAWLMPIPCCGSSRGARKRCGSAIPGSSRVRSPPPTRR